MVTVEIPHGGSGTGIHYWILKGVGCPIAASLADTHSLSCSPGARMVGTMVHAYLEQWRNERISAGDRMTFIDPKEGCPPPSEEDEDEAHRLFVAYCQERTRGYFGPVAGTEVKLSGNAVETAVGVAPFTALVDLITVNPDGTLTITDYKTSRASGNVYCRGTALLQLHAYYIAARASGYDVSRIQVEQITKTKTPKINIYEIDPPSPGQIIALRRFLQYAKTRSESGLTGPHLPSCDTCEWMRAGVCRRGIVT